jgi:hypothetical protein
VKYFDDDNIREYEMGAANRTYGDRRRTYSTVLESLKERDQLKDLGVDGHIILECALKWHGSRDKRRAVLNTVMKFQVLLIDWFRNCQLLK